MLTKDLSACAGETVKVTLFPLDKAPHQIAQLPASASMSRISR